MSDMNVVSFFCLCVVFCVDLSIAAYDTTAVSRVDALLSEEAGIGLKEKERRGEEEKGRTKDQRGEQRGGRSEAGRDGGMMVMGVGVCWCWSPFEIAKCWADSVAAAAANP